MKKKILIPTDFSKNAWNALMYATTLYKHQECSIFLLNTYGLSGYSIADVMRPEPGTTSFENAKAGSETDMEKLWSMIGLREKNPKHQYEMISEFGNLLSVMKNIVETKDIDVIVMGTQGSNNNNKRAILGSNTVLSMEKLRNCPTLGIPIDATVRNLKEIVFPTSYKTHYKHKELQYLIDIALIADATICIMHANPRDELSESQEENKQLLTECLDGVKRSFHHLHATDPVQAVQIFIESRSSDMVAIINKKHAFFGSVFTNSMVKELGMFSKIPLLVMHDIRN